ncbi:MAG: hypothetical protein LC623_06975 [Halobacteriales archaeon]|nr:hypothetical protein [Halobacteriales archaeon]
MELDDLLEQPYRAIFDTWLRVVEEMQKGRTDPSFSLKDATATAVAAGYKVGRGGPSTTKGVQNALTVLGEQGFVERPVNARTGKAVHGRYKVTGKAYFRGLSWLSVLRQLNAAEGRDVVTMRGADRPDFLSRLAAPSGPHVWATKHVVTDPDAPKPRRAALHGDAPLARAIDKAWEDLEKAVKDYATRDPAFPPFAVVLQFNPGVRPGRRQGTAPPPQRPAA